MTRIPVTILTGFLGAGKTTLLNRLIAASGFGKTAVIVNEFGEIGIDGGLVSRGDERAFAMSTGCLCCTVSGDVRLTLLRLRDEAEQGVGPPFDRIVIETTGLADPLPVLQTFMTDDFMLSRFALNGVVTLVDAVNGAHALGRFEEARRQIGVADLLILTKGELARDPASCMDLAALKHSLARLNPNARMVETAKVDAEMVFSLAAFDPAGKPPDVRQWLRFGGHGHAHHHDHGANDHGDAATAFCFGAAEPMERRAVEKAIIALQRTFGPDLLRIKGIVAVTEDPARPQLVHAVGHIASPSRLLADWPEGVNDTRLVVIVGGARRADAMTVLASAAPGFRRVIVNTNA